MNSKNTNKYFPIYFLLSWLVLTVLTFAFGPYSYKLINPFVFYIYILSIHLSLFLGYRRGQRSQGRDIRNKFKYDKFVKNAIIISLVYFVVKLIYSSGGDVRNLGTTFNDASESYENSSNYNVNLFSYIDMIFGPISLIAITNTIYSHKNLPKLYRYSVYVLIIFTILAAIGSATRSGIVQITIITMAAFLLGLYKKNIILKRRQKILVLSFVVCAFIGFLLYTSLLVNTRGGNLVNNGLTGEPPRQDFFLNKVASPESQLAINSISFYISHSYFQLNKAMNMPFNGIGFGLTNSNFIMNNVEKITGWSGLKDISYGVRLDKDLGVGNYGLFWATFYTWIASDFTFPGTIIVVFFIGYFFSLALKDSLNFINPLSVTVFCSFFYFIFHFAFNNPLQDGQGITTYLILPIIWFALRKRKLEQI